MDGERALHTCSMFSLACVACAMPNPSANETDPGGKTRVVNRGIDFLKAACEFADEVPVSLLATSFAGLVSKSLRSKL